MTRYSLCRLGSRGPDVLKLQQALNSQLRVGLTPDGIFGPKTDSAVRQFQRREQLVEDGIVGACTWAALLGTEKYNERFNMSFNGMHQAQSTPMSCWRAAAAMVLGKPQGLVTAGMSGANDLTGLPDTPASLEAFASHLGLKLHHGQSWSVDGLVALIRSHGPLMICGLIGYKHCFVIGGIRGDGSAEGTTLKIYDPDGGRVYPEIYSSVMRRFPSLAAYVLHR